MVISVSLMRLPEPVHTAARVELIAAKVIISAEERGRSPGKGASRPVPVAHWTQAPGPSLSSGRRATQATPAVGSELLVVDFFGFWRRLHGRKFAIAACNPAPESVPRPCRHSRRHWRQPIQPIFIAESTHSCCFQRCPEARRDTVDNGRRRRHVSRTCGLFVPPSTLLADHFLLHIRIRLHQALSAASTPPNHALHTCDIVEPAVPTVVGGNMGRAVEGSTQEEGVTFQEEIQANGRQGLERRHIIMSLSFLWGSQEDARPLPYLPVA